MELLKFPGEVKMKWRYFAHGKDIALGGRRADCAGFNCINQLKCAAKNCQQLPKDTKRQKFDVVPFLYFFFCFPGLRRYVRKNIKETINNMKTTHWMWEYISLYDTLDKGLINTT